MRLLELPGLRVKPKARKPKLDVSHAQLRQNKTIAPVNTAPHEQRAVVRPAGFFYSPAVTTTRIEPGSNNANRPMPATTAITSHTATKPPARGQLYGS
jgi:hypothetical protein